MSGHSKWSSIKHKKAAADSKRGKIFSRLGKEITQASREGGGDVEMNPRLRTAIDAAKSANMPNDNIDRAIKKGTGELGGVAPEELNYEGYGPGGVALLVNCLSDNRNRTAANIRSYFTKYNGNLAENGAVSWMFHRKARFTVEGEFADDEKLLELLLEAGADVEDVTVSDGVAEIIASPDALGDVANALQEAGIAISESSVDMVPENDLTVSDASTAKQVIRLTDALEEDEDVNEVYSNLDIPDEIMAAIEDEL